MVPAVLGMQHLPSALSVGMRVQINNRKVAGPMIGTIRWVGEAEFTVQSHSGDLSEGTWVGIELEKPMPQGKGNDGTVQQRQYFRCKPNHGIFVRPGSVVPFPDGVGSAPSSPARAEEKSAGKLSVRPSTSKASGAVSGLSSSGARRVVPTASGTLRPSSERPSRAECEQERGNFAEAPLEPWHSGRDAEGSEVAQRLASLEARVGKLERGHDSERSPNHSANGVFASSQSSSAFGASHGSAAGLSGLSEAMRSIEAQVLQHEASLKALGGSVEQVTAQFLRNTTEQRVAFIEGRLDALWSTLQGERLMEAQTPDAAHGAGRMASPRDRTGSDQGAIPLKKLRKAFDKHALGGEYVTIDELAEVFADLGFLVEDAKLLGKAVLGRKPKSDSKVTFGELLAAWEIVP